MTQKEQCEELLDSLLLTAEDFLMKNHEFYPVGYVMKNNGEVEATLTYGGNEHPDSKDVIKELEEIHRDLARRNEILVSGITYDAKIMRDGKVEDVIVSSLEHRDGYSAIVGLPYKFGLFHRISYGELFAQEGNHEIFHN